MVSHVFRGREWTLPPDYWSSNLSSTLYWLCDLGKASQPPHPSFVAPCKRLEVFRAMLVLLFEIMFLTPAHS